MAIIAAMLLTLAGLGLAPMEGIKVSDDGKGFVLVPSGKPFAPWGLNYSNSGRLIEDYWDADWPTVVEDFAEMKDLGANVVRVHLQFGKFMHAKDRPNAKALERLGKLLQLAEDTHLYVDLTGLACYRTADVPRWYDGLSEEDRWAAQAVFWGAIAEACEKSPAVFCYDLMNEPLAGGGRKPGQWYSGKPFGGYDFLQWIVLDLRDRDRDEVVRLWLKTMTRAIRAKDRRHLITVGLLPWVPGWGYISGFVPERVAPELDFISVHIYPEKGKVDEAVANVKRFAVGKPLVIEETFPLTCSRAELADFIERTRPIASGWMGHYDGMTIEQMKELKRKGTITVAQGIYLDFLELFRELRPR